MLKNILIFAIILLLTFLSNSCNNSIEPKNLNSNEISSEPKLIEIDINSDSLKSEKYPMYSIDYSLLKLIGVNLSSIKYYYPSPKYNIGVDKEFVIALKDSFVVEIKNCRSNYSWSIDLGNIELDNYHKWINSEVSLSRTEKIVNPDSTLNYRFIFHSLNKGKGYICFIEKNATGESWSNESHGLVAGFTIEALNKIILNVADIKWIYNTEEGAFSTVSVKIKGTTNVYRLRGMTYGDGVIMAMEIPIQNNSFESEIPIAFSHIEGITLKTNSELLLYGTVGLPKVITLTNPKSKE